MGRLPHRPYFKQVRQGTTLRGRSVGFQVLLATLTTFSFAGCTQVPMRVSVWVVDQSLISSVDPLSTKATSPPDPGPAHLKLAGAINETLTFCFAVRSVDSPIEQAGLRILPFTSQGAWIDPSAVRLFRVQRVAADAFPGWHIRSIRPDERVTEPPDVLVPIHAPNGGLPMTLLPKVTYLFWADIVVPKGTFEAVYAGGIELTSNGKCLATIPLELTIWPFILPDIPRDTGDKTAPALVSG